MGTVTREDANGKKCEILEIHRIATSMYEKTKKKKEILRQDI